jgi:cytochrome P450
MTTGTEVYYDPYDAGIARDPYPVYKRLREESPLYYNEKYDFYAVSRWDDIYRSLPEWETFPSGRGAIVELIKSGLEIPPGTIIFEDPPTHDIHRALLVRVFTPRRVAALEPQIREFCNTVLDNLGDTRDFDLIKDFGNELPMRVIGWLMGIPEEDQTSIREQTDNNLRTEEGKPMRHNGDDFLSGEMFSEYIDWRMKNPSNDLMTDLLNAEFEDAHGVTRTLTKDEILVYCSVLAGAGNETTGRLIGWMGSTLADHPDQRAELVANPALIPNAVEEVLRFQPPAQHVGRYVAKDVEFHGRTVPAGTAILFLLGSANRDEAIYGADSDTFNIHRTKQHLTFGYSLHYCMGAALARLEGQIALEEMLKRFPSWEVDYDNAKLFSTSTVRGWETLPISIG